MKSAAGKWNVENVITDTYNRGCRSLNGIYTANYACLPTPQQKKATLMFFCVPFESELLGDVKAGFPSPAEEIREKLDLIKLLVKHRASTFFFRVHRYHSRDDGDFAREIP